MTLNEYRHTDYSLAPVRNPLGEVRWWRYLGGRAYVNPFHDLLYAMSRNPRPTPARTLSGRQVTFAEQTLSVSPSSEYSRTYKYTELILLKLNYTCFKDPRTGSASVYNFLRLEYATDSSHDTVDLSIPEYQCKRLFKILYAQRVRFQEYYMGSRSFLLNTDIPYKRVQELKAEYGIDW